MSNQELLEYIGLFREKAEQGKLVIFVGAGVSCNVEGMPDWNSLIQNMAKAIGYSKCTSCRYKNEACEKNCLLKDDYSADEFLKIPQYVFNTDKALYDQVLTESISTMVVDAPLSSAIFDINPVHIITTNYDQLLESSKNVFREQYQVRQAVFLRRLPQHLLYHLIPLGRRVPRHPCASGDGLVAGHVGVELHVRPKLQTSAQITCHSAQAVV